MSSTKTILVGFDGSPESRRAARYAVSMARAEGRDVEVVSVVPPAVVPNDIPSMANLEQEQVQWAEKEVAEEAEELSGTGAPITARVVRGFPALELIRLAAGPDVELVVVGRAGKGALKRALLGSVSSRLAHDCAKPVVIIP